MQREGTQYNLLWATSLFGHTEYQMGPFTFAAAGTYAKIRLNKK